MASLTPPQALWVSRAECLGKLISINQLHPAAVHVLRQNMNNPWAIACSGGCDSVAALLLVYAHFPEKRNDLTVLHYNHKIRPEADADADYVRGLAEGLGLSFYEESLVCEKQHPSEAFLREKRQDFFYKICLEKNIPVLIQGHQQDDIAETLLMRIARGSGLSGLCAPRPVHFHKKGVLHARPLLSVGKDVIRKSLQEASVEWREDSTNFGDDYFRNKIRNHVLPVFKEIAPSDLSANAAQSRELLAEDNDALEEWAQQVYARAFSNQGLNTSLLTNVPKAICRRVLYLWLNENGVDVASETLAPILDAVLDQSKEGSWNIREKTFVVLKEGRLQLATEPTVVVIDAVVLGPETVVTWGGCSVSATWVVIDDKLFQHICQGGYSCDDTVFLNVTADQLPLTLRQWQPGDRYHPLGAPGSKKLQDVFIDKKIRDKMARPVIADTKNQILWVPGLAPAESARLTVAKSRALRLTCYDG